MAGKSLMDKRPELRSIVSRMIVEGQSNIAIAQALGDGVHKDTITDYRRHPMVAAEIISLQARINSGVISLPKVEQTSTVERPKLPKLPKYTGGDTVYFISCVGLDRFKVGYTSDLRSRLMSLRGNCPVPLEVCFTKAGDRELEKRLHNLLPAYGLPRIHGEWFRGTITAAHAAMLCLEAQA